MTGNVLPWAVLQFGGMALVLWLALLRPREDALDIRWSWVILAYAVAKLLEANDSSVYQCTGQLVSGHTLKHVVAGAGGVAGDRGDPGAASFQAECPGPSQNRRHRQPPGRQCVTAERQRRSP